MNENCLPCEACDGSGLRAVNAARAAEEAIACSSMVIIPWCGKTNRSVTPVGAPVASPEVAWIKADPLEYGQLRRCHP